MGNNSWRMNSAQTHLNFSGTYKHNYAPATLTTFIHNKSTQQYKRCTATLYPFTTAFSQFGNVFAWICRQNQRDATLLMNDLYYSLFGSTCFGLSPVHHQEHHLMNGTTHWYIRAGESSCCVDVHPRNIYKKYCISLVYLHIETWCTVHTMLNCFAWNSYYTV